MTDISEFRGKTADELKEKALELKKELFNLRFQVASGEQSGLGRFRAVRRDIARVKTALNEPKHTGGVTKKAAKAAVVKEAKATKQAETKETKAKKTTAKKKASGE
jgi:large subunit ribosomal protein L29